ncbi:unnamed protein product [Ixodes hexagonus]
MFLVGLTGGIASGKSTVTNILRSLDIEVIDADRIARDVVEPGKPAWFKIRREFGAEVFLSDGQLNRPALGRIVFSDLTRRKVLNRITHPEIHKEMAAQCLKLLLKGHQFVVVDVPLLYETKTVLRFLHKVIVVSCTPEQQLERLMMRSGLGAEEAKSRIQAQLALEQKCALANFVIDNTADVATTRTQVEDVVRTLRASRTHWKIRAIIFVVLTGTIVSVAWMTKLLWNLATSR